MQVSKARLSHFRQRVLSEYKESDAYRALRRSEKLGDRQRDSSVAVLTYLLDKGGDDVRWSELKDIFGLGGDRRDRQALEVSLRDSELNRILLRLTNAGFVERVEKCPASKRTKDRAKPEVYYRIPLVMIRFDEMEGGEDLDMGQWQETAIPSDDDHKAWLLLKVREDIILKCPEILKDDATLTEFIKHWGRIFLYNFSDVKERAEDLEMAAREWANSLPDTKWQLRAEINNTLDADGPQESSWMSPQAFERIKRSGSKAVKPHVSKMNRSHDP